MTPSRGLRRKESSELQGSTDHWIRFKTGDFGEKWNSSKLIVKEGKRAIAPLIALLRDPTADAETHWFTIRALGSFPDPQVITAIASQIGPTCQHEQRTAEQATELNNFAIETLAAMGTIAIDVLTQLLQSPQQRLLAAKALNQIRSTGVIPAMVSIAQDEDATVRYYAIDALGSFHNPVVTRVLIDALSDPAPTVRKAAVMALGRRPDLQTSCQLSQQIQPLLWDIDVTVCCQAALALGRLGAEDTIATLHQVLMSINTPLVLRLDIVRALAWYCDDTNRSGYPESSRQAPQLAYGTLKQALQDFAAAHSIASKQNTTSLSFEEIEQILVAIVRVLGNLRPVADIVTQNLITFLKTQPASVAVTQSTIMALADLTQPQAFEALLPLLNHRAEAIPIHTIAALKRLDPEHSFERVTQYLDKFSDGGADILELW